MDPATIAALATGITGLAGIIGAVVVSCCRKQNNAANKNVNDESTDMITVTIDASVKTVTVLNADGSVASVTGEKRGATHVVIQAKDVGKDVAGASNTINGFDHNALENAASRAAASTTTPTIIPSANQHDDIIASAEHISPETRPLAIDAKAVITPRPSQTSNLSAAKIEVVNGDIKITIIDFLSTDIRGDSHLVQIEEVGEVDDADHLADVEVAGRDDHDSDA